MKVVYMTNTVPYPPCSGNRMRHYSEILTLSSTCEVHLIVFLTEDCNEGEIEELAKLCKAVHFIRFNRKHVRIQQLFSLKPKWHLLGKLTASDSNYINNILRPINPDVYIANYFDVLTICGNLDLDFDRIIFIPHDSPTELYDNAALVSDNLFKKLYYRLECYKHKRFEAGFVGKLRNIIVFSKQDRNYFGGAFPSARILISPIAINTQITGLIKTSEKGRHSSTILIIGSGRHPVGEKEVYKFIREMGRLLNCKCTIRVIGPNWVKRTFQMGQIVVVFAGYIDDLRAEYQNAAAVVVPLFYPTGLNVKLCEALNTGIPVLCTKQALSRLPAWQEAQAIVCESYEDFASKMCAGLKNGYDINSEDRAEYIKNHLSYNSIMGMYAKFINDIVADQ